MGYWEGVGGQSILLTKACALLINGYALRSLTACARAYFLSCVVKKETKKTTPAASPLRGYPALLKFYGCCGTRYAQTVLALFP